MVNPIKKIAKQIKSSLKRLKTRLKTRLARSKRDDDHEIVNIKNSKQKTKKKKTRTSSSVLKEIVINNNQHVEILQIIEEQSSVKHDIVSVEQKQVEESSLIDVNALTVDHLQNNLLISDNDIEDITHRFSKLQIQVPENDINNKIEDEILDHSVNNQKYELANDCTNEEEYLIGVDIGSFKSHASYYKIGTDSLVNVFPQRMNSIFYGPKAYFGERTLELIEGESAYSIEYLSKYLGLRDGMLKSEIVNYVVRLVNTQVEEKSNKEFIVAVPYRWNLSDEILKSANITKCYEHEAVISYFLAQHYNLNFKKPDERVQQQLMDEEIKFSIFNMSGSCVYKCHVEKKPKSTEFEIRIMYYHGVPGVGVVLLSDFINHILEKIQINHKYIYEDGYLKVLETNQIDERSAKFTYMMNNLMINLSEFPKDHEMQITDSLREFFSDEFEFQEQVSISQYECEIISEKNSMFNLECMLVLVGGIWNHYALRKFKNGEKRCYLNLDSMVSNGCILSELLKRNFNMKFTIKQ